MFCFVRSLIFFLLCCLQAPLKFAADLIDFLGSEAQVGNSRLTSKTKKIFCFISLFQWMSFIKIGTASCRQRVEAC